MACRQRLCPQWEELSPEEGEKEEEGYEEKGLRGRGRGGRCRGKLQPLVAVVMHSNITAEEANEGGQGLEHSAADRKRRESQTLAETFHDFPPCWGRSNQEHRLQGPAPSLVKQVISPLLHSDPELVEVSLLLLFLLVPPLLLHHPSLGLLQQQLQVATWRVPQFFQLLLDQELMKEGLQVRRLLGVQGPAGARGER